MKKCRRKTLTRPFHGLWKIPLSVLFLFVLMVIMSPVRSQEIGIKRTSEALRSSSRLETLINDLHSTLYLTDGEIKTFGDGLPIVVECDMNSIHLLAKENSDFIGVKLIKLIIKSSPTNAKIDLSLLKSFTTLECIQLVFTYDACGLHTDDCLEEIVRKIVVDSDNNNVITALYSLSIPN